MNLIRPSLKLINGSAHVAKVELRVEPGETIEVPEGSVLDQDRVLSVPRKAPAKKAAPTPTTAPVAD